MREDGAENPQIPGGKRDALDDDGLIALDQFGLAEAIHPHPEARADRLLLGSGLAGGGQDLDRRGRRWQRRQSGLLLPPERQLTHLLTHSLFLSLSL